MHQTNGGFVYVGINFTVRVKFLSDNNETTYGVACVFCCVNLEDNCNKFDGIVQMNLGRDKVEIVSRLTITDESPAGATAPTNFDNKNKLE